MTDQQQPNSLHDFLETDGGERPHDIEDSAADVGTRIAEARAAAGQTQEDIANRLGVKVSTIDKWERGAASPRSNRLASLAGVLGVSVSWLMVGYGNEPTSTDDLDEMKVALGRVQAQLTDTLNEVEVLMARLDAARTGD